MVVDTSSAGSSSVTPMLPETSKTQPRGRSHRPVRCAGCTVRSSATIRSASAVASSRPSATRTANSSPPSAADEVAVADRGAQPRGHLDEQVVARLVAGDVVDRLEAVEVEQQQAAGVAPGDAGARARSAPP